MDEQRRPPPGLNGDYSGSCIGCLTGTDTAVAIAGPAELHAAFLSIIGLSYTEALLIEMVVREAERADARQSTRFYRICARCGGRANVEPRLATGPLNTYAMN